MTRSPHPADRRIRIIVRTGKGDEAVAVTNRVYELMEEEWAAQVGPDRWEAFRSVLVELAHLEG